jgi:hypothetical protein
MSSFAATVLQMAVALLLSVQTNGANVNSAVQQQALAVANQAVQVAEQNLDQPGSGQVLGATAPAFVQLAEKDATANSNTIVTGVFGKSVTAGDLIVAWVWYNSTSQSVSSVTDTDNDAYTRAVGPTTGTGSLAGWQQELWYAKNVAAGSSVKVTATFTGKFSAEKSISAHEYSGLDTASPLDVASAVAASGITNASTPAVSTNFPTDLIFGAAVFGSSGTAGPGFIQRSSIKENVSEDELALSQGSYAATFTNPSDDVIAQMAAFKASGATNSAPVITSPLSAQGTVGSAFSYQITASNNPTSYNATPLPPGLSVNTATGLISGTPTAAGTTNVTISGTNSAGTGNATLVITISNSTGDTTPPSVPTNLSASAISSSQINLSWTASTDNVGVAGYKIFRNGSQVGTSATNSYNDTGLAASTNYTYTVSAYDAAGNNSAQSASANATTQSGGTSGGGSATLENWGDSPVATWSDASGGSSGTNVVTTTANIHAAGDLVAIAAWCINTSFTGGCTPANPAVTLGSQTAVRTSVAGISDPNGSGQGWIYYVLSAAAAGPQLLTFKTVENVQLQVSYLDFSPSSGATFSHDIDSVAGYYSGSGNTGNEYNFTSPTITPTAGDLLVNFTMTEGHMVTPIGSPWSAVPTPPGWPGSGSQFLQNSVDAFVYDLSAPAGTTANNLWELHDSNSLQGLITSFKISSGGGGGNTAPSISSFTASPSSITTGQSTLLSWSVSGTPAPTLSINNGVGTVTGTSKSVSPSQTTTYILTATNSAGTATANTTVTVGNSDITPPTASIASPANNSTVSGTISVSGTASDNVAVSSVAVSVDGGTYQSAQGTTSWNYSLNTASLSNGTHTITAQATDSSGNLGTSATITVTVNNQTVGGDTTPPSIPTNLSASALSSSQINLAWTASTDPTVPGQTTSGLAGYKIYRGGVQVGTSATNSYSDTGLSASTQYTYAVSAYDNAGNTSAQSGSASATTSGTGNKFTAGEQIQATANLNVRSTPNGTIVTTEKNGSLGTIAAGPVLGAAGIYNWWQVNWNNGFTGWSIETYMAPASGDTTPPTVSLVSPVSGANLSSTVPFSATASDNVQVALVAFSVDGNVVGTDTTAPYTFNWNSASVANGTHTVTATAVDTSGNAATTAPITVIVSNPLALANYVQGNSATNNAAATTIAQSFISPNTAGNTIIAVVSWDSSSGATSAPAVTDSAGNFYTIAAFSADPTHSQDLATYYASGIQAGANTVTASFGSSAGYRAIAIHEYSGLGAFDVTSSNVNNSGSAAQNGVTSNAAVTTGPDLIFGAVANDSGQATITSGSGFVQRQSGLLATTEDTFQSSAGSAAATFTFSAAQSYLAQMLAFRAAGGGGSNDTTPPSIPTNLSASALSSSQINLAWTASTDPTVPGQTTSGLAGYKIYRGGVQVGTSATNSYSDTGLSASTQYTYAVSAYDNAGNTSAQSGSASATTSAGGTAGGRTFYIAANGNDSNNGTSKTTPWLHAPGMPNCTATCKTITPQPGDSYIFRGGDTWHFGNPNAVPYTGTMASGNGSGCDAGNSCGWSIGGPSNGWGSLSGSPIYFGVDQTWYNSAVCGGSWCRPIMNGDNPPSTSAVASCTYDQRGFSFLQSWTTSVNYTIDNFEWTGLCWGGANENPTYVGIGNHFSNSTTNRVIENNYFHGWTHVTYSCSLGGDGEPVGNCQGGQAISGPSDSTAGVGDTITHNVFDGSDADQKSFSGILFGGYIVEDNVFTNMAQGAILNNNHVWANNLEQNIYGYSDGVAHGNGIEMNTEYQAVNVFYNNVFRNFFPGGQGCGNVMVWAFPITTDYEFNNIAYGFNCSSAGNFWDMGPGTTSQGTNFTANIFNNTWVIPSGSGDFGGTGATANFVNNHCVLPGGGTGASCYSSAAGKGTMNYSNDVVQTPSAASTQGYTSTQTFAYSPTSASDATVGAGANEQAYCNAMLGSSDPVLQAAGAACRSGTGYACTYNTTNHTVSCPANTLVARPTSGAWDAGAYQYP